MKICKMCNQLKSISKFMKDASMTDGIGSYCKECNRQRVKDWKKDNEDKVRQAQVRRNVRLIKMGNSIRNSIRLYIKSYYKQCLSCGNTDDLTIDHVIPIFFPNSSNNINNLQLLCRYCNSSKGKRTTDYRNGNIINFEPAC